MGLFDIKRDNVDLRNVVDYINQQDDYKDLDLSILEEKLDNHLNEFLGEVDDFESNLCDLIITDTFKGYDINKDIDIIISIYNLCKNKAGYINNDTFRELCSMAVEYHDILMSKNILDILGVFKNVEIGLRCLDFIFREKEFNKNVPKSENFMELFNFILSVKQYFNDDEAYLSFVFDIVNRIGYNRLRYSELDEIRDIIEVKHEEIKQANFIYPIDVKSLQLTRAELAALKSSITVLLGDADTKKAELASAVDSCITAKDTLITDINGAINNARTSVDLKIVELKNQGDKIKNDLDNKAQDMETVIWSNIFEQWKKLVEEFEDVQKSKLEGIGEIVKEITDTKNATMAEIKKFKDFLLDDLRTRQNLVLDTINKKEAELKEKLDNITNTTTSISDLLEICEEIRKNKLLQDRLVQQETVINDPYRNSPYGKIIPIEKKDEVIKEDEIIDPTVNYYLNSNISNQERVEFLKYTIEKYNRKRSTKNFYPHKGFFTAFAQFIGGIPLCIYGPSGSGKTFSVEKMADFMGIEILSNQFIDFPHRIEGFMAANGMFVPSLLYKAYKEGKIYCVNEFDRSDPTAAMLINEFSEMSTKDKIVFPNGETVYRHPNFRLILTANTDLMGNNSEYNSAKKQDGATTERFVVMEFGYDDNVESKLLKDYPEWREFIRAFRSFNNDRNKVKGTFTTRDAVRLIKYKEELNYIISDESIMYLLFIQQNLHDSDTKSRLIDHLKRELGYGNSLVEKFEEAWNLANVYHSVTLSRDDYSRIENNLSEEQQKLLKKVLG